MPRPHGTKRVGLDFLVQNLPEVEETRYSVGNSVVRLETWSTIVDGSMVQLDGIDLTSRQGDLSWLEVALKIPVRSARSFLRQIPLLPELERAREEAGGGRHHGNKIMEDCTLAPNVVEITVRGNKLQVNDDK